MNKISIKFTLESLNFICYSKKECMEILISLLHLNKMNDSFFLDLEELNEEDIGNSLIIYLNDSFLNRLKENTNFFSIIKDNALILNIEKIDLNKDNNCLVECNLNKNFQKNSLFRYINKNYDNLNKSKSFKDFVLNMNYSNPLNLHEKIFKHFKENYEKDINEIVSIIIKKESVKNNYFFKIMSNSNMNEKKIFFERVLFKNFENIDSSSYGFLKVRDLKNKIKNN